MMQLHRTMQLPALLAVLCCAMSLSAAAAQPAIRQASPRVPKAVTLTPVSAHGFDALDASGDPRDENDSLAGYAIDQSPVTSWRSQYYLGNPVFGGLKAGTGLIVDMGRKVRIKSVTVTFGNGIVSNAAGSGYEINVTLIALALVIVLLGTGRFSLDVVLRAQLEKWRRRP